MALTTSSQALDAKARVLWAADRAERVLVYFEMKCPGDHRPRKALEAARAWTRGEVILSEVRSAAFAAHAAAREAADLSARAAARAAGHAAATAHVPAHAAHAADYADRAERERDDHARSAVKA